MAPKRTYPVDIAAVAEIRKCSMRLQAQEERNRTRVEEVKITELDDDLNADTFHALYLDKKSIIIGCSENRLQYKDNYPGYHLVLLDFLTALTVLLSTNTFKKLEKLTFEDVPVTGLRLQKLLHVGSPFLPNLRSITIKRNCSHIHLSEAFGAEGPPVAVDSEGHNLYNPTYKLPGNSLLETISFEPGIKESTEDDLEALYNFVVNNSRIQSIKVLNSNKLFKHLTIDSPKKESMQRTLTFLYKRHYYTYRVSPLISFNLKVRLGEEVDLRPWLLSHAVAKLLSASGPDIFDEVHHGMAYAFIREVSNTKLLVDCLIDDQKNDAVNEANEA